MAEAEAVNEPTKLRVWDLPTRLFHWLLAANVLAAIVTAKTGGNAMSWHTRFGCAVLALLAFRFVWGFVGGHWSRFRSFAYAPSTTLRYLRGGSLAHEWHRIGHDPLGSWSVFALLAVLVVQVATGLVADDEIATRGPLAAHVSAATVSAASHWHRNWGQGLIIALALAHVIAVLVHFIVPGSNLVGPMFHGDKPMVADAPAAVDHGASRALALAIAVACVFLAVIVARLGD